MLQAETYELQVIETPIELRESTALLPDMRVR